MILQHHRVFQTFRSHLNRNDLSFGRLNLAMRLDVWNAIRNSLPAFREWMPWAQPEPELHKTEESLRKAVADFITRQDLRFHLYHKETGEVRWFIGTSSNRLVDSEIRNWLLAGDRI